MVECFERVWTHWERFLVTTLAQLQQSRFSSVSMCIEVVFFYIFPVTKGNFYISYIYFLQNRVLTFNVLSHSSTFKELKSHFSQLRYKGWKRYAHKVLFCTFSDLLKIFYMWPNHMNLQIHYHKTHSHSSHLNGVRD